MTQHANKRRIFVVEDEALIMMGLRDRLEKLGYEVCDLAPIPRHRQNPSASSRESDVP